MNASDETQQQRVNDFTVKVNNEELNGYALRLGGCLWIYVGRGSLSSLHLTHFPRTTPIIFSSEAETVDKAIALRLGKLFPQQQVFFSTDLLGSDSEYWKRVYDQLKAFCAALTDDVAFKKCFADWFTFFAGNVFKTGKEILRDKTPKGKLDAEFEHGIKKAKQVEPYTDPYLPRHPNGINEKTGEVGGPAGPEPTRFGDWERKGRVTDF
ncbi:unnamed protein product, partial [Mesorhabditis belari]|uniref:Succinate dehydrogenase assembly factor 4, mitochondrial n=1 Tax=Mesorhabditis belari TaxID=2138241 RepID=A0AAF3EUI7_9BILA